MKDEDNLEKLMMIESKKPSKVDDKIQGGSFLKSFLKGFVISSVIVGAGIGVKISYESENQQITEETRVEETTRIDYNSPLLQGIETTLISKDTSFESQNIFSSIHLEREDISQLEDIVQPQKNKDETPLIGTKKSSSKTSTIKSSNKITPKKEIKLTPVELINNKIDDYYSSTHYTKDNHKDFSEKDMELMYNYLSKYKKEIQKLDIDQLNEVTNHLVINYLNYENNNLGLLHSYIINNSNFKGLEHNFNSKIAKRIDYFGYNNSKSRTVNHNLGKYAFINNRGNVEINGTVYGDAFKGMKSGKAEIKGDVKGILGEAISIKNNFVRGRKPYWQNTHIYVNGNVEEVGKNNIGGYIKIEGDVKKIAHSYGGKISVNGKADEISHIDGGEVFIQRNVRLIKKINNADIKINGNVDVVENLGEKIVSRDYLNLEIRGKVKEIYGVYGGNLKVRNEVEILENVKGKNDNFVKIDIESDVDKIKHMVKGIVNINGYVSKIEEMQGGKIYIYGGLNNLVKKIGGRVEIEDPINDKNLTY